MKGTEKEIRDAIADALKAVDRHNAPSVFEAIQSEAGYRSIENQIIQIMANEDVGPSTAILAIEGQ